MLEFSLEFVQLVDKITKALALKEEIFFLFTISHHFILYNVTTDDVLSDLMLVLP